MARTFSGRRLCERRTANRLRHEHVAVVIGRSAATVHRYESGGIEPPANVLAALAAALDCRIDDLFEESAP